MTQDSATQKIFVALDTTDRDRARSLAHGLSGAVGGLKVGKEFFTAHGPDAVRDLGALGLPIFLDLKFHDIPNTVAGAVRAALPLKPAILNVHAAGGRAMMEAARASLDGLAPNDRPWLIAVTVLTSLDRQDLGDIGVDATVEQQVLRLARLAQASGLDGVVCSPREIGLLRLELGPDFKLVVPGIRPDWAAGNDQKRVMTPAEALNAGADVLVIGRAITGHDDPGTAASLVARELQNATDR